MEKYLRLCEQIESLQDEINVLREIRDKIGNDIIDTIRENQD